MGQHTYYMQQHVSDYLGTISSSISSPSDDDSRVHLAQIPGVEGSDYINANFIDVSSAVHVSNAFDSSSRAQYLPSLLCAHCSSVPLCLPAGLPEEECVHCDAGSSAKHHA